MNIAQFQDAISLLEGIGLVRTFKKSDDTKSMYIYELILPLTPKRFFNHEVLNTLLYRTLGQMDYERTKYYFKLPVLDTSDYQNVSASFDEVFHIDLSSPIIISKAADFEEESQNEPSVDYNMALFYEGLEDYRIPRVAITKEVENAIVSLGVVYRIEPLTMRKLVYDVYEGGQISISDLQERCLRYYEFEHQINLNQVHEKKEIEMNQPSLSKRDEKIKQLESSSPYQYIQALQKGANPTSRDLALIEKLMTEQKFPSGVVNVIVETVLLLNNGQLPKNHLEYVAGMFARKNVKTVPQAIQEAKEYMASRKEPKKEVVTKTVERESKIQTVASQTNVSQEDYDSLMSEIQKMLKGEN
jgi:replication initiation and membrane attachment protein